MLTAHGGAEGTGRNTHKYFDSMKKYNMDAIEVDIWNKKGVLYLAHAMPKFSLKKAILLKDVFLYCKEQGIMVNCDLKQKNILKVAVALAKSVNAEENIYFTGSVTEKDIKFLTCGKVYLNRSFFKNLSFTEENLPIIKEKIEGLNNTNVCGINVPYKKATESFIKKAKELGVGLSVYTVDDEEELNRLIPKQLDNITTNLIEKALEIRKNIKK